MAHIEITMNDEAAAWANDYAVRHQISISRLLRRLVREAHEYQKAYQQWLAVKPRRFEWVDGRRPTREELYDRSTKNWDKT